MQISRLAFATAATLMITGCGAGPLYVQTAGTVGPLQWKAIDLRSGREVREGKEVDTYDFTLILRETGGVGLIFTSVSSSVLGGGWSGFGRHSDNLQLPAYCELRMPLSATGFKSPLWFVYLSGKDEHGKAVTITITVALPPNPAQPSAQQSISYSELQPELNVNSDVSHSGVSLALLSLEHRRRLRVASIGLNPKTVAALLSADAGRLAVPISSATVTFDSRIPLDARQGLRNIASWLLTGLLPIGATMTLPLDSQSRQNLAPAVRFTRIDRGRWANNCSQEILVENAGEFIDFSSLINTAVFEGHDFTLNDWSDEETKALSRILIRLPNTLLSNLRGLAFKRGPGDPGNPDVAGNYNSVDHAITMYDLAFQPLKLGFVGADKTAGVVAHELGHAIDFAPLRRAYDRLRLATAELERSFGRYRTADNRYEIPPGQEKSWQEQNRKITTIEKEMYAARSESGSRWQLNPDTSLLEIVDDIEAATGFRNAATMDGPVRITSYADKSWSEYFAECFSLYIVDPELLKLLRPNIYAYFSKEFPR